MRLFAIPEKGEPGHPRVLADYSGPELDWWLTAVQEALAGIVSGPDRNSRPVTVLALNEEVYDAWAKEPRRKGHQQAGYLTLGQVFPSAKAASMHLGYPPTYNRVSNLLAAAAPHNIDEVTEHGVTWRYLDTFRD